MSEQTTRIDQYELEVKLIVDPNIGLTDKDLDLKNPQLLWQRTLPASVQNLLNQMSFQDFQYQKDIYWDQPCIDIKSQGSALRNRNTLSYMREPGQNLWHKQKQESYLTYKGPKQKSKYKLREEIEFPASEQLWTVFERLSFHAVDSVEKARWTAKQKYTLDLNTLPETELKARSQPAKSTMTIPVAMTIDIVQRLGVFMEIEVVLNADSLDLSQSEAVIERLLQDYKLDQFPQEEKSYLTLIQEKIKEDSGHS